MAPPRRLLSIAHSYVVALNRRLAHEMARAGAGQWEVTAVAPTLLYGDLRPVPFEWSPDDQCRIETVPVYGRRRVHVMLYGQRLRNLLRQSWDMVHCWEEPFVLAGAQIAWWTPRQTPFVFWTAQNIPKRYPPPFSWGETYCLERCAGWMACGDSVVTALLPRGYGVKPHRVLPLGIDVDHFRPNPHARAQLHRQLEWDTSGPPVVGYLGRFVPEKGLHILTQTLDRLSTPWRALFVGSGPMESSLRAWSAQHGHAVRVVTDVTHDRASAYLNAMDVLCAPSQTTTRWREQFGRVLIEAFASGVPVIASDSGEIPSVVRDAGMLVGEKDDSGWVHTLADTLESPHHRAILSERGLERARTIYAWPVIAQHYLDFFDALRN